jgi:hypothetical protein
MLAVTAESPGLNCSNGGSRVDSGLDANRNGQLDASEITSTQYVCSAGSAVNSLVETRDEAAGSNCPSSGKQFTAGLDANSNGVLDIGEINSSGYICNGAQGSAGARALTVVVPESAGGNCASGGVKINSGSDGNGNGTLDVAEVTGTQYVCNGASATNTLIRSDIEAAGSNCTYGGTRISAGPDTNGNATLESGEVTATAYACNGAPGPGVTWEDVTGTSVQALGNRGYVADNDTAEVVVTLPAAPAFGDLIQVYGLGAGGWRIAQNASQFVVTPHLHGEGGTVWTARESNRNWRAVASSADGQRLVAAPYSGQLYTSSDAGASWTARESDRIWRAVASSADGQRLVAAVGFSGQLYTSSDAGVSWTARESNRYWWAVASSSDGQRLVAAVDGGQLYTSAPPPRESTTAGAAGSIRGLQYEAITLQYVGANKFVVVDFSGDLIVL